jgi:hypothetical protein
MFVLANGIQVIPHIERAAIFGTYVPRLISGKLFATFAAFEKSNFGHGIREAISKALRKLRSL